MKTDLVSAEDQELRIIRGRVLLEICLIAQKKGKEMTHRTIHGIVRPVSERFSQVGLDLGYDFPNEDLYGKCDPKIKFDLMVLDLYGIVDEAAEDKFFINRLGKKFAGIHAWLYKKDFAFGRSYKEVRRLIREALG